MTEVFTYLCGRIGPGHQMKRKSGANPELSRGGEALSEFSGKKLRATDNHIRKVSVRRPAIQKNAAFNSWNQESCQEYYQLYTTLHTCHLQQDAGKRFIHRPRRQPRHGYPY